MKTLALGAFLVALAIALGAFGSHALAGLPPAQARFWAIASDYHFIGAFGVVTAGLLRARVPARGPAALLGAGIVLFSGSLYAMALDAPRALGRVTPIGGICLLVGWAWLGVAALRARSD